VINPLVYAEVSVGFGRIEELEEAIPPALFRREALPHEAAFLAGKVFLQYRRRGGVRATPLPDFYIGAHAAVAGFRLLTRDTSRYRTYFPSVELIAPPVSS
jgi:predicted nucleic acid-binding protein